MLNQNMTNLGGFENISSATVNSYSEKSHGSPKGFENQGGPMTSLVAPNCTRKFENLQDYLLEVSKALGERQSFYSFDLADVIAKIQTWKKALPQVQIYYAVKANPDPVLLKLLVMLGMSFDCATENEIGAVLRAGADASNILWAHTVKPISGLLYARSLGVDTMTFDDEEELRKIHRVFPTASFHVGGLCSDPDSFSVTIRDCRELFEHAQRLGSLLTVLDIGGGFFGAKGTEPNFYTTAEVINEALRKYFSDTQVNVIGEPGCYVVGSAVNLVCTVIGKRNVVEEGRTSKHYFLNNGIYGSFFRDIEIYDIHARPLLTELELRNRSTFESTLFGLSCSHEDIIARSSRLPDLSIGDCLMWDNMGAYSYARCTTFCGMPLPVTVYVYPRDEKLDSSMNLLDEAVRAFLQRHAVFIGQ